MIVDNEAILRRVAPTDESIPVGVAGETPTHWVIALESIYEVGTPEQESWLFNLPIPLVPKDGSEVIWALPQLSPELFEGFTASS